MIIQKDIKILVVDDDQIILKLLEKFLISKKIPVVITDSPVEAARLLKKENFDILITDINMPEINGFELILWMKNNKIPANIIVLTANYTEAAEKSYAKFGVLKFMPKPINFDNLIWTINVVRNDGFVSKVTEINLFDYLQMINFAKKDKIVTVTPGNSKVASNIYIKEGEIIHAIHGNLKGEEAFFKIMSVKGGIFTESPFEEPGEITVNMPVTSLIFRAGEIIDEENMKKNSGISPELLKLKNKEQFYNVLITDDDENIRNLFSEYLQNKEGINVEVSGSAMHSAKLLKEKPFDLAIVDINMPEVNGFEFLLWMKKNNIDVKVILMSEDDSEETKNFAYQHGSVKFFHKGSTIQELLEFIKQDKISGFTGIVSRISIFDYVQMIMLTRKNKLIVVRSPLSNSEGHIYFKNGSIIHAVLGDIKGKEAFFKIVSIMGGIITELPWNEPSEISITGPSVSLLFKATQYLDQEILNLNEIKIDENMVKIIENKIKNADLNDREKFTASGSFQKNITKVEKPFPVDLKITPFLKNQNSFKSASSMFNNASKQKSNIDEEILKPFEGMKLIIPILTRFGENVLSDPKTPISSYQLLKKFDGNNSLDFIYQNYYYHILLNEFISKIEGYKNNVHFTKKAGTSPDKDLKGKIIQVLIYMKFLDTKEFVKKINEESIESSPYDSPSGEILLKFGLISEEQLNQALQFQKKFNNIIDNLV